MRWSKNRVRCRAAGALVRGRGPESGVVVTNVPFDRTRWGATERGGVRQSAVVEGAVADAGRAPWRRARALGGRRAGPCVRTGRVSRRAPASVRR
ncbi:hypothetical protein Stsp01_33790 [Streptomyces sp. NBRC 13847]|nr:hypothetical protein Stsp01_33790 [Streptomyces sp. NBRC 13847]